MSKRSIIWARALFVLYLIALGFLCFWNFNKVPDVSFMLFGIIQFDKLIHFLMFLPFPVLFYLSVGQTPRKPWVLILYVLGVFLLGCIIAAGTEFGQSLTKYRHADPADFKADSIALAISALAVFITGLVHMFKRDHEA
ncbi:MAG: VanZ family protein [Bacteroidales bacterium]|nr:VanZ family protein [Bacteroidales bacterium]